MEKLRILQRLGKGSQGSVYLVKDRQNGEQLVLKKIECNDESDANKAFSEALALKKLSHPFICSFKDLFVHWDKQVSAMFVCILMQYYKSGDLSTYIRQKREASQYIDELIIKRWLGQIIDALVFIHSKNVIHRDLKPSNILVQEDDSIAVGDFGVATVMADVLTRTRTTVGTMNYMSPEVLDRPHDARTDVWSLGCIALELATCGLMSTPADMAGLLSKIKHDQNALSSWLHGVNEVYRPELAQVIQQMLHTDHDKRPTPTELASNPYIRECLQLSGATLLERQRQQRSARRADRPCPTDKGAAALVDYIADNLGDDAALRRGLEGLSLTTRENVTDLNMGAKRVIAKVMSDYHDDEGIQTWGCQVYRNIMVTVNTNDILYSPEIIDVIIKAMEAHPKSCTVQKNAAEVLMGLSADEAATASIGTLGGIQSLLKALQTFPDNVDVCIACLGALWSLTVNEDNVRTLTQNRGIFTVVKVMQDHATSHEVQEAGCAVLLALSMEDENIDHVNKLDCVGLVIDAMQTHIAQPKLVKNGCMALAAIVEPDEESAFRVLTNTYKGVEVAGIPILLRAYENHKDNAEVVENIITLALELVEYEEISAELKYLRVYDKVLMEVYRHYKENQDIIRPCEKAMQKLGASSVPLLSGTRA